MAAQKATPGFGSGVVQKLEAIMDDPNFENPKECTGSSVVTMGEKGKYRCVNVSPGGVSKPENGQCPRCLTAVKLMRSKCGWCPEIEWQRQSNRSQVECSHCHTIFGMELDK